MTDHDAGTDHVDTDAQITIARSDLHALAQAAARCWAIDLDRLRRGPPPGAIEEWESVPGYTSAAHPELRRPNVAATHEDGSALSRPAPWNPPGENAVETAYINACREILRAHRVMAGTDWPADGPGYVWTPRRLLPDGKTDLHPDTIHVPDLRELLTAIRWLSWGLEWARGQDLRPPEAAAVLEACDHACQALKRIPKGLREEHTEHVPDPRPACLHCGDRDAERDRKWCAACRRAHQRDRGRCHVCGLSVAS